MDAIRKLIEIYRKNYEYFRDDEPAAQAEQQLYAFEAELQHRFVVCTFCGWRLDYEADGREQAHAAANAHALECKSDPRNIETERLQRIEADVKKLQYKYAELSGVYNRSDSVAVDVLYEDFADELAAALGS